MAHAFPLPDGRTIHLDLGLPGQFIGWMEGDEARPIVGAPLSGVIAELIGLHPAHDEKPGWLDAFAERAFDHLRQTDPEGDAWFFGGAAALRGATFVHARWQPPPPEWVSVSRDEDGRYGSMSIRGEPGSPSWSSDEPPAWDHDHCELCQRRLADDPAYPDADAFGWRTGDDWRSYRWICELCFSVFGGSLDFKRVGGS